MLGRSIYGGGIGFTTRQIQLQLEISKFLSVIREQVEEKSSVRNRRPEQHY